VEAAFTRLVEQINKMRQAYQATGFRGKEGWDALQGLVGNYRQNPALTKQLLMAAMDDLDAFRQQAEDSGVRMAGAIPDIPKVGTDKGSVTPDASDPDNLFPERKKR
jgi:hypothetical protein